MTQIRVLVVDDHNIVRDGIRMVLEAQPDLTVIGEAADGRQALERVRQLQPDIVLMDLAMPVMGGLEATRLIKTEHPNVQVLILTMQEGEEYFFRVLSAGASGYVLKGARSSELIAAVHSIYEGGVFLYPTMAKKLVGDYLQRKGEEAPAYDGLSARELEVLRWIAEGKTNQEIAELLVLSINTVQTHRSHIMEKLQLHNRAELIRYAIRKGLIETDA